MDGSPIDDRCTVIQAVPLPDSPGLVVEAWYWPAGTPAPVRYGFEVETCGLQFGDLVRRDSQRSLKWWSARRRQSDGTDGPPMLIRLLGDVYFVAPD